MFESNCALWQFYVWPIGMIVLMIVGFAGIFLMGSISGHLQARKQSQSDHWFGSGICALLFSLILLAGHTGLMDFQATCL